MPVFLFSETAAQPGFRPSRSLRTQPARPKPLSIPSPSLWASENLHFLPDPRQTEILDTSASRVLLCCSRQWGKSTVTAIRALHYAWFHPGSLTVVVAPALRQSRTFLDKIRRLLRHRLGVSPRRDPRAGSGEALSLLLPNGSAILRDIRPFPLETPYADIASLLSRYLQLLPPAVPVRLAVDATGVGAPVVELLTRANLPVTLQPIVITAGQSVAHLPHATSVPRDALLQNLRIQLECDALRIPAALPHRSALQDELTALGVRPSHPDDLAFALALALWSARPNPFIGERPDPLPGAPFRSR